LLFIKGIPMSTYTYDLPATPAQREAIGMVATEWQRLESIIDAAIWSLARVPNENIGRAITTNLNLPTRLDILKTLFDLWKPDEPAERKLHEQSAKELSQLCHVVRHCLSGLRGSVVHAEWVRGEYGSPMTYVVEARGKFKAGKVGLPASKIQDAAALIAQHSEKLAHFLQGQDVLAPP
jgi:hypothetical protein